MYRFFYTKKLILAFAFLLAFLSGGMFFIVSEVSATRTISEIEAEKLREENKLKEVLSEIQKKSIEIENLKQSSSNLTLSIQDIKNEIKKIELELSINQSKSILLETELKLKNLEKERLFFVRTESLKVDYIDWRSFNKDFHIILNENNIHDYKYITFYQSEFQNFNKNKLVNVLNEINNLEGDITKTYNELNILKEQRSILNQRLEDLFYKLNQLNSQIENNNTQINNLNNLAQGIRSNISMLTEEQRIAQERLRQIEQVSNPNTFGDGSYQGDRIQEGSSFSIFGRGRDLKQGHGVGLSQFGAYGMADLGWNYEQILKFYYKGVDLVTGYENFIINVSGFGEMNIEDYVTGQDEIPAKACGNQQQVSERPDKYALSNGNIWSCWPEEAIKAMIVAYRTYAINYVLRTGRPICTNISCQVFNNHYKNMNISRWAAEETKGVVIVFSGSPIEAVYSSDNNQGFGTANNDTVFQSISGDGTHIPYLRSVNDTEYTYKTEWQSFTYKTNTYNLNFIENMLNEISSDNRFAGKSYVPYIKTLISDIGSIKTVNVERDPSLRVKRVIIEGINGTKRSIGGFWFRSIWNEYVYINNIKNSNNGQFDYIYSQTFFFQSL